MLPKSVADPSPFSSPDGDFNPFLLCTLPQLLIRNLFGPPHSQDVLESAVGKSLKLGDDLLSQTSSLVSVKEDGLHVGIEDPYLCPQ